MTVKGKRAEALRKMDSQEASRYGASGFVDGKYPVDAVRSALKDVAGPIDIPTFETFFAPRIGRYRAMADSQQDQPSVSAELALVDEAMTHIEQLRLRLESLPPDTEAHIDSVCWKRRREMFCEFRQRLDADLEEARVLLVLSERELEPFKGNAGRKSAMPRDWLLHDVAKHLNAHGVRKERAADVAAAVLRASGVDAPDDPREARKLVRKVESLMGE